MWRASCLSLCFSIARASGKTQECASSEQNSLIQRTQIQAQVEAEESEVAKATPTSMPSQYTYDLACSFESNSCDGWKPLKSYSGWKPSTVQPGKGPSKAADGDKYLAVWSVKDKNPPPVGQLESQPLYVTKRQRLQFKYNIQGVSPTLLSVDILWKGHQTAWKSIIFSDHKESHDSGDVWHDGEVDLTEFIGKYPVIQFSATISGAGHTGSGYVAIDAVKLKEWPRVPEISFEHDHFWGWKKRNFPALWDAGWERKRSPDEAPAPDGSWYLDMQCGYSDRPRLSYLEFAEYTVSEPMYFQFKYKIVGSYPNLLRASADHHTLWEQSVQKGNLGTDEGWKDGLADLSRFVGQNVKLSIMGRVGKKNDQACHLAIDNVRFFLGTSPPTPQPTPQPMPPTPQPTPPTPQPTPECAATVYQHKDLTGWSARFTPGSYDVKDAEKEGFKNDDASSIRVDPGCEATVYQHGDFHGWSASFGPGSYQLSDAEKKSFRNDDASAIKVKRVGDLQ